MLKYAEMMLDAQRFAQVEGDLRVDGAQNEDKVQLAAEMFLGSLKDYRKEVPLKLQKHYLVADRNTLNLAGLEKRAPEFLR